MATSKSSKKKNPGIRLVEADHAIVERAAKRLGLSINKFGERALVAAARFVLKTPDAARFSPGEQAGRDLTEHSSR